MRYTVTFFFFILLSFQLFAQQAQLAPQYSMYMLNTFNYNPAYAGLDNSLSMTGVYRKQWVNLEGSPTSQNVNVHLPLYILRGGFGVGVENETLGVERNTSATVAYNFWMPIGRKNLLTFGLGGGIVQKSLDGSKLRTRDGDYNAPAPFDHKDPILPLTQESAIAPTFSAGVYFQSPAFEMGIAVNNLTEPTAGLGKNAVTEIQLKRNYFINFAYYFEVSSEFTVQPSALLKSDLAQTQLDFSMIVKYNSNIFGGATFRGYNSNSIDAIALIGGLKLSERVTLAYSYDLTLSTIKSVNNGSHEVLLNYNLSKPIGAGVPPAIIYNPRFL